MTWSYSTASPTGRLTPKAMHRSAGRYLVSRPPPLRYLRQNHLAISSDRSSCQTSMVRQGLDPPLVGHSHWGIHVSSITRGILSSNEVGPGVFMAINLKCRLSVCRRDSSSNAGTVHGRPVRRQDILMFNKEVLFLQKGCRLRSKFAIHFRGCARAGIEQPSGPDTISPTKRKWRSA